MLYFVPTPIGNLADISYHALEILQKSEIILCEDTRVGKKLLSLLSSKFDINFGEKSFFSVHSHNETAFLSQINTQILREKDCVFMSDAGMPCICDPGREVVNFALKNDIKYEILTGANATILAVAASGIIEKEFVFLGFLPNTGAQRKIAIQNALNLSVPCVIYESPKRILQLIENFAKIAPEREIFLIKEATKKFETKFRANAEEMVQILSRANLSGEWVCVLDKSPNLACETITCDEILALDIPPKQKAKLLAKITGEDVKKIYEKLTK
ncbi:MAG: 16S rRNA (cytidine(1402)-2'-O)-methyltransferase [Campylobacter sp.]